MNTRNGIRNNRRQGITTKPSRQELRRLPNKHAFIRQTSLGDELDPPPTIIDPSDKAKLTMFNEDTGRITLEQYEFLVRYGYNGETVKQWTHYHASTEIEKFSMEPLHKFRRPKKGGKRDANKGMIKCPKCNVPIKCGNLPAHLQRVHIGNFKGTSEHSRARTRDTKGLNPRQCPKCGMIAGTFKGLKEHLANEHKLFFTDISLAYNRR